MVNLAAARSHVADSTRSRITAHTFGLTTSPRAWRPGLEPAELSFRVPHFFHQTRRCCRGAMKLYDDHFFGNRKKKSSPRWDIGTR